MNHFEAFGFAPRPWLEPEALKEKYLRLSAELHPDKADPPVRGEAETRFAAVNNAYAVLNSPRARLIHFLEAQGIPSAPHVQAVPPEALEFFTEIADCSRKADELAREKAQAGSPMLKAALFERGLELTSSIQEIQGRLAARVRTVEGGLQELDRRWPAEGTAIVPELQSAAAALGFLERWSAQLRQRLAALAF